MNFSLPWETCASGIQSLAEHEVFVFGSNATGFHGAGSAGQAMRGDARNTWRTDAAFLAAKDAPAHSPLRVGHWAVFGQARGPMQGHSGKSYAVQTIVRPGQRRSLPLGEIGLTREVEQELTLRATQEALNPVSDVQFPRAFDIKICCDIRG